MRQDRDEQEADASSAREARRRLSDRSSRILEAIDELRAMESEKRKQAISTPEFHRLAADITAKSRDVFRIASEQEGIGDEIPRGPMSIEEVDQDEELADEDAG